MNDKNLLSKTIRVRDFLSAFFPAPDEKIFLRTFKAKNAPNIKPKARSYKTTLVNFPELKAELQDVNKAHGIYFVVNSGGNSKKDITRFNAAFVENDSLPMEQQHTNLDNAPILPSIRIETSKSVHAYWLLDGNCSKDDWIEIQKRLIAYFDGDKAIKDASRVMRLPHFNHVSFDNSAKTYNYKRVEIAEFKPERRYVAEQLLAAFPAIVREPKQNIEPYDRAKFIASDYPDWINEYRDLILAGETESVKDGWEFKCPICGISPAGSAIAFKNGGIFCRKRNCELKEMARAAGIVVDRHKTTEFSSNGEAKMENEEIPKTEKAIKVEDVPTTHIVCLADIKPEKIDWLWLPYIALGNLTIFEGDPGVGKSQATCAIAAAISSGVGIDTMELAKPRNVLMLSAEDNLNNTVRPRLDKMNADVSRIFAIDGAMTFDNSGLAKLESYIAEIEPSLVIIDPLFAYTGGKMDIYRDNEVRAALTHLKTIAEKHSCAIIALRHLVKRQTKAKYAGGGSIAFTAAARSVLLFGCDERKQYGFVQSKNNLAEHGAAFGYSLENGFSWTGECDLTEDKILSTGFPNKSAVTNRLEDAEDFLVEILTDERKEAKTIMKLAERKGIAKRTLTRAKESLEIVSQKIGEKWFWRLPETLATN